MKQVRTEKLTPAAKLMVADTKRSMPRFAKDSMTRFSGGSKPEW